MYNFKNFKTDSIGWMIGVMVVCLSTALSTTAEGFAQLGTGAVSLVGGDLTDQDDTHDEGLYSPPTLAGFDAEFFANDEPTFGSGEAAFNVFDNEVGGLDRKWCCGNTDKQSFPLIVGADFSTTLASGSNLIQLTRFTLTSSNDTPERDPRVWQIQGSTDTTTGLDGSWTTIYSRAVPGSSDWTMRNQVISYSPGEGDAFLTSAGFKAFRLKTDATGLPGASAVAFHALNEVEFFGDIVSTVVPEPATISLFGLLGAGLIARRRSTSKKGE